jgi:hypothetical protein
MEVLGCEIVILVLVERVMVVTRTTFTDFLIARRV